MFIIARDLRDSRQDLFGQITTRSGRDRMRQFALGARWQATRSIVLGCEFSSAQAKTAG